MAVHLKMTAKHLVFPAQTVAFVCFLPHITIRAQAPILEDIVNRAQETVHTAMGLGMNTSIRATNAIICRTTNIQLQRQQPAQRDKHVPSFTVVAMDYHNNHSQCLYVTGENHAQLRLATSRQTFPAS